MAILISAEGTKLDLQPFTIMPNQRFAAWRDQRTGHIILSPITEQIPE